MKPTWSCLVVVAWTPYKGWKVYSSLLRLKLPLFKKITEISYISLKKGVSFLDQSTLRFISFINSFLSNSEFILILSLSSFYIHMVFQFSELSCIFWLHCLKFILLILFIFLFWTLMSSIDCFSPDRSQFTVGWILFKMHLIHFL